MYDRLNLTRFPPRRILNFEGFLVWQGMNRICLFPCLLHGNLIFLLVLSYRALNFYLYGVSIVLQLVNFLPFAIALCLYNHLSLSLMFLLL